MRAKLALIAAGLIGGALFSPAVAPAADFSFKVDGATPVAKWAGTPALGLNQTWTLYQDLPVTIAQCGKLPINYCEDTLIQADVPAAAGAKLKITLDGFGATLPPEPAAVFDDFDVFIFTSDATGKVGDFVGTGGEGAGVAEVVTLEKASGYYLVRAVYYAVLEAGYNGTAELIGAPKPAVVLTPPGTTPPPAQQQPPPPGQPQPQPQPGQPGQQPPMQTGPTGKPTTLPASGPLRIEFAVDKGKRKTARKRGMRARLRCSVQCKATAVAKVSKKVARQLKLGKKAFKIGKGSKTITKPGRIPFFVKVNKKAKRALGRKRVKKFKVTVTITVKNLSGKQVKKGKKVITLR